MLVHEETISLIRRAKEGDGAAREILLENNTSLLKSIVKRFLNRGIEYDDLYQLASLGFLKAIKNFDENFSVMFSTYAVPMIIGEIKRFLRDDGSIKVSRAIKVLAAKISRYSQDYRNKYNMDPDIATLAEHFSVEKADICDAMDSSHYLLSLNEKDSDADKGRELGDTIPDKKCEDDVIDKIMLRNYIEKLSGRDKKVIILRYYRDKTQSEIARELGVSQVQISRIESRILQNMRVSLS